MKLRLLKDWAGWPAGRVWDECQIGPGNLLVMRGIAEKVLDENPNNITTSDASGNADASQGSSKDRGQRERI